MKRELKVEGDNSNGGMSDIFSRACQGEMEEWFM